MKPLNIAVLLLAFVVALMLAAQSSSANKGEIQSKPAALASQSPQAAPSPARLEGCVSCHDLLEPMHKYGTTDTLDKLKGDKDAVGLSCTACHGGNPIPKKTSNDPREVDRVKELAHVRP